jgi:hypothetical protein
MKGLFFSDMNQLYSIRCRFNRVAIENILVGAWFTNLEKKMYYFPIQFVVKLIKKFFFFLENDLVWFEKKRQEPYTFASKWVKSELSWTSQTNNTKGRSTTSELNWLI